MTLNNVASRQTASVPLRLARTARSTWSAALVASDAKAHTTPGGRRITNSERAPEEHPLVQEHAIR